MADSNQQATLPWRYLITSLALHVLLFLGLIITLPNSQVRLTQSSVNIVQAVAIDERTLPTQVNQIPESPGAQTEPEPVKTKPIEEVAVNQAEPAPVPLQENIEKDRVKEQKIKEQQKELERLTAEADKEKVEKKQQEAEKLHQEKLLADAEKKHEEDLKAIAEKQQLEKARAETEKKHQEELRVEEEKQQAKQLKMAEAKKKKELAKLAKQRETEMAKALDEQLKKEQQQIQAQSQDKKALEKKRALAKLAKEKQQAMAKALNDQLQDEQQQLASDDNTRAMQGELDKYKSAILSSIGHHWLVPPGSNKEVSCQLLIHLAPGGVVLDVVTVKSSGDEALDHSAQTAVMKASPLPVPSEPTKFNHFRELRLTVRPEQVTVR